MMKLKEIDLNSIDLKEAMDIGNILKTSGELLQSDLGLEAFGKNVWIQKVLQVPMEIYIVTYNSRFPSVNIGTPRIRGIQSTLLKKLKRSGIHFSSKELKTTPPIRLYGMSFLPSSNALIFQRDIAGEYMREPKVFQYK